MITDFPDNPIVNLAGKAGFLFCPIHQIVQLPAAVKSMVTSAPIFAGNYRFFNGLSVQGQLNFDEGSEKDDHGPTYPWLIAGFYPGEDQPVELFAEMETMRHLVVVTDRQGKQRLVGLGAPLEFKAVFSSGKAPGEPRGYNYSFYGTGLKRAPLYLP